MRGLVSLAAVSLLAALLACSPLGGLSGLVGGGEGAVADQLWSDVPPYPGADQAELELPLFVRVAVEATSRAVMTEAGDSAGSMEFVAYTSADSADQVQAFYSLERMAAEGWDYEDAGGCSAAPGEEDLGGLCLFGREGDQRDAILFIFAARDDGGSTSIFYIRLEADPGAIATAAVGG